MCIPSKPIFVKFSKIFVIYLLILKIIVYILPTLHISVYLIIYKIIHKVCKIFKNNILK